MEYCEYFEIFNSTRHQQQQQQQNSFAWKVFYMKCEMVFNVILYYRGAKDNKIKYIFE